jgi:GH35 family endo-1,4-beta-xylanase
MCLGLLPVVLSSAGATAATVIEARHAATRTVGAVMPDGVWNLWSQGQVTQPVRVLKAGTYRIEVRAYGSPAGGVWPEMAVLVDGLPTNTLTVACATAGDYSSTVDLAAGVCEIGVSFLNDAVIGNEDRNLYIDRLTIVASAGSPDPQVVSVQEAAADAADRERDALAEADRAIEQNRKVGATVRVVDHAGQPIAGVEVRVEQVRHEFLFGCNIYRFGTFGREDQEAAYRDRFAAIFNYATTGFYWIAYEPKRGQPNYAYTDRVVAWCQERGIRLKGHPLLWGEPAGIPPWSKGQPPADVQHQRILDILGRYRGKIDFWEIVNEPSHLSDIRIDEPYRWAREADPQGHLIVNDYEVLANSWPRLFQLLEQAQRDGVPFDGIGIQAHEPRTMRFPLHQVKRVLDQYAKLGKAIHITEFTPTSGGEPIVGGHREGVWNEAAQADYAEKFYRVCFAHPAVRAITWWDFCDDGAWLRGGGMLRPDLSPKPVYERLKQLIHGQWKTQTSGRTDAAGRFVFRGFAGHYLVVAATSRSAGDITQGRDSEIVVRLP